MGGGPIGPAGNGNSGSGATANSLQQLFAGVGGSPATAGGGAFPTAMAPEATPLPDIQQPAPPTDGGGGSQMWSPSKWSFSQQMFGGGRNREFAPTEYQMSNQQLDSLYGPNGSFTQAFGAGLPPGVNLDPRASGNARPIEFSMQGGGGASASPMSPGSKFPSQAQMLARAINAKYSR
ncbi:MAG: hypothetical protein ACPG4X_19650 [Pikeienuella sp.]